MQFSRRHFLLGAALVCGGCGTQSGGGVGGNYLEWGHSGAQTGAFRSPRAITAHRKEVYVIDKTGRIQVFDFDGQPVRNWRTPSPDNGTPTAISFSRANTVLIADTHYSRIIEYSIEGEELGRWGEYGSRAGRFIYPTDIEEAPDGTLFVSEYGEDAERVQVFSPEREPLRQWGTHGNDEGQFSRAMALELGTDGTIYVCDSDNHRVQCFSPEGEWLRSLGGFGDAPGQLKYPFDISLASNGALFVCEYGNNRVSHFSPGHNFVRHYGRPGRDRGEFSGPRGVAVSDEGLLFIADTGNDRVVRFSVELDA